MNEWTQNKLAELLKDYGSALLHDDLSHDAQHRLLGYVSNSLEWLGNEIASPADLRDVPLRATIVRQKKNLALYLKELRNL